MDITPKQKKELMRQAHQVQPVVTIGNKGLTNAVHMEIDRSLDAHELIKIKITGMGRDQRQKTLEKISEDHDAALVNVIGFIGIFYRKNEEE